MSGEDTPADPSLPADAAASVAGPEASPGAASAPAAASARLVWERASGERVEFPLDGEVLEVGRDEDVAIRVDEPLVSRRHATIERRGEGWVVVDQNSTNFTRVNGDRVRRERELAHGDELRFGRTALRFLND